MPRISHYILLLFVTLNTLTAQIDKGDTYLDTDYLEDQFYLGITYNTLLNRPSGVTQRSLSYGLMAGFIKDIPVNTTRTTAIGLGLGYAFNSYFSNLLASNTDEVITYSVLDSDDFQRNSIANHLIEVPLEFRWRNSTPSSFRFWRIYAGAKFAYIFSARSKFVSDLETVSFSNPDIRRFQYGLTFNFGYSTFNLHLYYALSDIFDTGVTLDTSEAIELRPLRIGFIFYIL